MATLDELWGQAIPKGALDEAENRESAGKPSTARLDAMWGDAIPPSPELKELEDNEKERVIKKESQDLVLEAIKEIPLQFAWWKSEDTKLVDIIGDEGAAWMVGAGHKLQDVYRGAKQMLGVDIDEEREAERLMNQLYQHEELGDDATWGAVAGSIAEPASLLIPGAKARTAWQLAKAGMKVGAVTGAAGYVDKDSGQTLLGNAVAGAVFGGVGGAAIGGVVAGGRAIRSRISGEVIPDNLVQSKTMFEREVAERKLANKDYSWQQAWNEAREDMPKLYASAKKVAEETGEAINPIRMSKNLEVYKAEEANIPIDTIAPSTRTSFLGKALNEVDRTIGIMSSRIKNIHKPTYGGLRTLEANLKLRPEKYGEMRKPFADYIPTSRISSRKYDTTKAFTKEQTKQLNLLLVNGKIAEARSFIAGYKGEEAARAFDKSLKVIDDLGDEMIEWGVIDQKIDNYWPRTIAYSQVDEFKKHLNATDMDKTVKGWWNEEVNIHNITMAKKRKIEVVDEDMIEFYENPLEALDSYIHHAVKEIEMAKFLGKDSYAAGLKNKSDTLGLFNLEKSLDHWAKNNPKLSELHPDDKKELLQILQVRFGKAEEGANEFVKGYKAFVNVTLLANPISALTQLGDLGSSMFKNKIRNTFTSVFSKDKIMKMQEMGLGLDRFAEFEDIQAGWQKESVDKLFKLSGFHWADKLGKETYVDAALKKAVKMTDNLESRAARKWASDQREFLGSKGYSELLRDIKAYKANPTKENLTDNMRIYLLGQLADVQPIYASELAAGAVENNRGKFFFTLKSFMMKQLDVMRNDSFTLVESGLKSGNKGQVAEGMRNLAGYMYIMGTMNVGVDYLKDLVLGREKLEDAPETVQRALTMEGLMTPFSGFAKIFGLNEYTFESLGWKDPSEVVSDWLLPPIPAAGEMLRFVSANLTGDLATQRKELTKLSRYLPLIGRFWVEGSVGSQPLEDIGIPPAGETVYGSPPVASFAQGGQVNTQGGQVESVIGLSE